MVLWIKMTGMVKIKHKDFRCSSNYALSKLVVDNGLEDLWRKENPDSSEFICYDRSFAKDQYRPSIPIFGKGPIEADELGRIWILLSPYILSIPI